MHVAAPRQMLRNIIHEIAFLCERDMCWHGRHALNVLEMSGGTGIEHSSVVCPEKSSLLRRQNAEAELKRYNTSACGKGKMQATTGATAEVCGTDFD
jgi:hypothetical protein